MIILLPEAVILYTNNLHLNIYRWPPQATNLSPVTNTIRYQSLVWNSHKSQLGSLASQSMLLTEIHLHDKIYILPG